MDAVHLFVYVGASFLALRALVALMAHHREHYRQQLYRREAERRGGAPKPAGGAGKPLAGGAG
ncbi:MAG TPA: hypothetical protein VML55_06015 [Planctomycetaceae bacterium]|nr:hypothetical protein [Planctomycetaceae bacterium]